MKLICSQSELSKHLALVGRAVPSRPTHPVLATILVIADQESQAIQLTAFDLSLGIQSQFSAQVQASGKLTLPAKVLTDIVSRLPSGELTIETTDNNHAVTITSTSGQYQLRGMNAEEFPALPEIDHKEVIQVSGEHLSEGLKGVLFAASSDETKQVITGVHVKALDDGFEFAATDGHRLSIVHPIFEDTGDSSPSTALEVNVPAKALLELVRLLASHSESIVNVQTDQSQIVFDFGTQVLTSRLLEGQYPNYNQLVPARFSREVAVDRKLFLSSLERIAVLGDQRNNVVRMQLAPENQQLTLLVDAQDVGNGKEEIPAQISGDALEIAFNIRYVLDGLKALQSSSVLMRCNTATSPAVLNPTEGVKVCYLIMPVQVKI